MLIFKLGHYSLAVPSLAVLRHFSLCQLKEKRRLQLSVTGPYQCSHTKVMSTQKQPVEWEHDELSWKLGHSRNIPIDLHTKYKYNIHILQADNSYDCVGTRLH